MRRATIIAAAGFLLLVVVSAVFAPTVARYDPVAQDVERRLERPGRAHLFGTDGFGRDVFSRVVHGARASLTVGFGAVALAGIIGVAVGLTTAYAGGLADLIVQRAVDVLLGFPFLVLALIVIVALSPSVGSLTLAIGVGLAPQIARVARSAALPIVEEQYVAAARACGAGPLYTVFFHILPNAAPPIVAQLTGYFGAAVAAEAALSFLGLGVPPPFPSWGRMLQEGTRAYFEAAPWVTLLPGLVLSLTVMSCAILGDTIRDATQREFALSPLQATDR
ncbi:MAG: ABC transporter permease [Spirochaetaceae bacterium]|nr:MAG: ABC transporter permease [Spirochaetaceae bacterium]